MTTSPKDRLLAHLTRYGDVFPGWEQLPDDTHVRTDKLRHSPAAQWHQTHWEINGTTYPLGAEHEIAHHLRVSHEGTPALPSAAPHTPPWSDRLPYCRPVNVGGAPGHAGAARHRGSNLHQTYSLNVFT